MPTAPASSPAMPDAASGAAPATPERVPGPGRPSGAPDRPSQNRGLKVRAKPAPGPLAILMAVPTFSLRGCDRRAPVEAPNKESLHVMHAPGRTSVLGWVALCAL